MLENIKKIEQEIKDFWKKISLRNKVMSELKKRKKKYFLLEGPPYVNDKPHVGHLRGLVYKDVMIKFKFLEGYDIYFRPGFDTHGLPIEVKVEKTLGIKEKREIVEKVGIDTFISKCWEFAKGNEKRWLKVYESIGHWYAWKNPYLTYSKTYIETEWYIFKKIWEKGLVYLGKKPIHWCPHCQTALSGYEVTDEYANIKDPSIFVKFKLKGEEKTYLLVWTTTPWTLVANVAIAAHPDEYYVKVKVGDEYLILAEKRLCVLDEIGVEYEVVDKFIGKKLEGLKYEPVIENEIQNKFKKNNKAHKVYMSIPILKKREASKVLLKKEEELSGELYEHLVTMEEGTGLVHIAPGHGKEDYEFGKFYGLPVYSPVDEEGRFTIGKWKGIKVRDANDDIINYLEERGFLFYATTIVHRYPLCWRCKTPLIFRLSDEWFINIQKNKKEMLKYINKVKWYPSFAKIRMINWVTNEEDWCISRKRFWGTPIPIWMCENCGNIVVIGSIEELKERGKLKEDIKDLHRNVVDKIVFKCEKCGGIMRRVRDIFDVWFDASVAPYATFDNFVRNREEFNRYWRPDRIIEGQDQIRGWFDRLLDTSVAAFNDYSYESVCMIGWVVDEKGEKMSKRLGNVVWAEDAYNELGADILRFYILWETAMWDVMRFSLRRAKKEVGKFMNVLLNTLRYLNERGKDVGYDIKDLKFEDVWIISRFNRLVKDVTTYIEEYQPHLATRSIFDFVIKDLSRWYIKLVRKRVQEKKESTPIGILREIMHKLTILISPVCPHVAEYIYQNIEMQNKKESIFFERWPEYDKSKISDSIEQKMDLIRRIYEFVEYLRDKKRIKSRWKLEAVYLPKEFKSQLKDLVDVIKNILNTKEVVFGEGGYMEETELGKIGISEQFDIKDAFISELIRRVQEMRKKKRYKVYELKELFIDCDDKTRSVITEYKEEIERRTNCKIIYKKLKEFKEFSIFGYTVKFYV